MAPRMGPLKERKVRVRLEKGGEAEMVAGFIVVPANGDRRNGMAQSAL